MSKNLIIDGQILQTPAWHRGMGKYMLQVLQQLSMAQPDDMELSIIFNTRLDSSPEKFEAISFLCPNMRQIHCDLPVTLGKENSAKAYKTVLKKHIEENFGGQDNYYLLSSLFYFDFFAEFPDDCHKLVLLYDLTPLLFWKDLGGYFPPDLYLQRFQRVLEAETILSISETTRQDLISTFGLNPKSVVNIKGGFTKVAETTKKPSSFSVPSEYILFPTGEMPHKNNKLAIRGFEEYHRHSKKGIPLLVTSKFQEHSKQELLAISENIIFTDNVSDEELEWLYEHASAVLFASKYEGLGMPILDAVAHEKPIITSKISVFEEMSKRSFYFFDQNDYEALAVAIQDALQQKGFAAKRKHYPDILEEYTWANTGQAVIDSVTLASRHEPTQNPSPAIKPYVAVACLHPGIAGQAGRIAEALHAELSKEFVVDYYFDANGYHYRQMERPTFLDYFDRKAFDVTKLTRRTRKKYQAVIYIVDPATFPSRVAQRAAVLPGLAITDLGSFEFNQQDDLFKAVVLGNQNGVYALPGRSYGDYRAVVAQLSEQVALRRQGVVDRAAFEQKTD